MKLLQFVDHLIPYDTFLNDLSARIVRMLKTDRDDPEFVSRGRLMKSSGAGTWKDGDARERSRHTRGPAR